MTDREWQLQTYRRFLMLRGGTTSELDWSDTGELIRLFLHYFPGAAQGTEAQRAETVEQGSVHDGPVREANAPNNSRTTP